MLATSTLPKPNHPVRKSYDTVLIDTRTVGHSLFHAFYDELEFVEDFLTNAYKAYCQAPMFREAKKVIWMTDSKPYWRTQVLSLFDSPRVYKGTRSKRGSDMSDFLQAFDRITNSLHYPHFEADDLIATYVRLHPEEEIAILSVDSDLIQLTSDRVTWCCAKGYYPQMRSPVNGGLKEWMVKKMSKLSTKRIGHLDLNDPASIVEWKVIYGDTSDNIPPGEASRVLIDLLNVPKEWQLELRHPEFLADCKAAFVFCTESDKRRVISNYQKANQSRFPTLVSWLN